jgi:hypothetical protein
MIRVNVRAGLRDTRRIQCAAREKRMTVSEFAHYALRRVLGRSSKVPPTKPPVSEKSLGKQFRTKRSGSL